MKTKIKIFSVAFGSCLLITAYANAQSPDLQWVKQTAGNSNDFGSASVTDHSGNIYMTGQFAGMADFDPGPGIFPLTAVEGQGLSAFICKLDASGNLIWAKKFDGVASGKSICMDDSGHIYTTGSLYGTVDFDPGPGIHNLTSQYTDAFFCKWDTAGNFIWANSWGTTPAADIGYSITVDMQENVYVTGYSAFICKLDKWGNLLWTKNFTNNFPYCKSIAVDASGNILTTGQFEGPTDFDPGPGIYNLDGIGDHIFISKLDSNGSFLWAKDIGGNSSTETDIGYSITTDASENIYTTGEFMDTVDFNPGAGVFNLISHYSRSSFILKLGPSGNFKWAKSMDGIGNSWSKSRSITLDPSSNIITTGNFSGTVDFDPDVSGTFNLTSSQYATLFVNKLDSLGNFVWAGLIGGSYQYDYAPSVVSDDFGNVLTTGFFQKTADFDPGPAIYNLSAEGDRNIFISKLNVSGNFVWAKSIAGSNITIGKSDVDAAGNIYTTGGFEGTVDFDPGPGNTYLNYSGNEDAYVRKINSSGNLVWAKSFGGPSVDYGKTVAVDNSGNVYLSGYFSGTADFNPGPGVYNLTGNGNGNGNTIYVSKLDANGNFLWAKMLGEKNYDSEFFGDMDADASGNIYLTGTFIDTIDFDPGPGIYNLVSGYDSFSGDFNRDSYVLKLDASGNFQWAYAIGAPDGWDRGNFITVDGPGNVYLSGNFGTDTDFDPGPGIYNLSMTCAPPSTCILKLTATGNFVWAKTFECYGWGNTEPGALFARSNGTLFLTGGFNGTVDFDPGPGIDTLTAVSGNYSDMYIVKINSAGNFVWNKKIEASSYTGLMGSSISCDNPGNVYASGGVYDNFKSAIFCKLNAGGNLLWNHSISEGGGFDFSSTASVGLDQHDNLYLTGVFASSNDFDLTAGVNSLTVSGTYDVFIAKYGSNNPVCSTAPISIISNATANTICGGQQVTLTIYGGALSQSGDFYWYANSCGGTFLGTGSSINVSPSDTTTYYVRVEDSCGVTSCVSLKIKVKTPVAPPTITGNSLFCQGSSGILDAGSGYAGYQWSTGSTAQTTVVSSGGQYTVTISSGNGCTAATSIIVTVNQLPSAVITYTGSATFCMGDTLVLNAPAGANKTYQWKKGGTNISGGTNSSYAATTGGSYKVTVTNTVTGCSKTSENATVLTTNPQPSATITPQGPTTFCAGGSVLLKGNAGTGYTYQWKKGGNNITAATNKNYTATIAGIYKIKVTNSYGCSKLSTGVTVTVPCKEGESESEGESVFDVKVYPNPSSGDFIFETVRKDSFGENSITEKISVSVYDMVGKLIESGEINNSRFIIHNSQLTPGVYAATITDGKNKKVVRLIKTK